ncbi:MAG: WD40 repeat domain-containing protein [Anaerolineae bacterium]
MKHLALLVLFLWVSIPVSGQEELTLVPITRANVEHVVLLNEVELDIHVSFLNWLASDKLIVGQTADNLHILQLEGTILTPLLEIPPDSGTMVAAFAISPDGNFVAICLGSYPSQIQVFSAETGQQILTMTDMGTGFFNPCNSLAFSPDGRYIASGHGDYYGGNAFDAYLRLWDAQTGELLLRTRFSRWEVRSVGFSPDSHLLIASADSAIHFWDVEQILNLPPNYPLLEEFVLVGIGGAVFSPDGRLIAYIDLNQHVNVWNIDSESITIRLGLNEGLHAGRIAFVQNDLLVGEAWNFDPQTTLFFWSEEGVLRQLPTDDGYSSFALNPQRTLLVTTLGSTLRFWGVAS